MLRIMTREEFQEYWNKDHLYFYGSIINPNDTRDQVNEKYKDILEREYLKYVNEQVKRITSIEC